MRDGVQADRGTDDPRCRPSLRIQLRIVPMTVGDDRRSLISVRETPRTPDQRTVGLIFEPRYLRIQPCMGTDAVFALVVQQQILKKPAVACRHGVEEEAIR